MWHARPIFDSDMAALGALIADVSPDGALVHVLLDGVDLRWDATAVVQDDRLVACGIYRVADDSGHSFVDPQVRGQGIEEWLERWTGWRRDADRRS